MNSEQVEVYKQIQKSPLLFIKIMWGLSPQRVYAKYAPLLKECREQKSYDRMELKMFEPFTDKMITWQQAEIVLSVERSIKGGKKKISVSSGHGIGKSTILAMLIIWYLFSFYDCRVPCTAPTQTQMQDVLWAEIQKWLLKLPEGYKDMFIWSTGYVRIAQRSDTWYARARTSSKERPEALAGLHADNMLLVIDEASGVPDSIFDSAKAALTGPDTLMMMISNYTRLEGYFHASQTKFADDFQVLSFNSEHSPIVDNRFIEEITKESGYDSDEYRIRVMGKAPRSDLVDDGGFLPLISDFETSSDVRLTNNVILGIDPSGEGKDWTIWTIRDNLSAKIVAREHKSTIKSMAAKTLTLMCEYDIHESNIVVDNFGVGANLAQELGLLGYRVCGLNVGLNATSDEFLNIRAELFWRLRKWLKGGGVLCKSPEWEKELKAIKYKRNLRNKIQIMSKDEMRKHGIPSPNAADSLMLTFFRDIPKLIKKNMKTVSTVVNDDPY